MGRVMTWNARTRDCGNGPTRTGENERAQGLGSSEWVRRRPVALEGPGGKGYRLHSSMAALGHWVMQRLDVGLVAAQTKEGPGV